MKKNLQKKFKIEFLVHTFFFKKIKIYNRNLIFTVKITHASAPWKLFLSPTNSVWVHNETELIELRKYNIKCVFKQPANVALNFLFLLCVSLTCRKVFFLFFRSFLWLKRDMQTMFCMWEERTCDDDAMCDMYDKFLLHVALLLIDQFEEALRELNFERMF